MKSDKPNHPFFIRFLENSIDEEMNAVKGQKDLPVATTILNDMAQTDKYPSDNDEDVTLKYPSDNDEILPHDDHIATAI